MRGGTPTVLSLPQEGEEFFSAARVSMGALGVITHVTLQCVPFYDVELNAYKAKFEDIASQAAIDD
jgi:FAD/FMN-containing dehydrogenase